MSLQPAWETPTEWNQEAQQKKPILKDRPTIKVEKVLQGSAMFFMIPKGTDVGGSGFQMHVCPTCIRCSHTPG